MALGIAIAVVAMLLGGFILLTSFEQKKGARLLAPLRARLDVYAKEVARMVRTIDVNALAYTKMKTLFMHLVHEVAHGTLIVVRALERTLTSAVRTLRHKKESQDIPPKIG